MESKEKTLHPLCFRLREQDNEKLLAYCDKTGIPKGIVVRIAVNAYLEAMEKKDV